MVTASALSSPSTGRDCGEDKTTMRYKRLTKKPSPNPTGIIDLVSRADGGPFYTVSQVAQMIGKSKEQVKRYWQLKPNLKPKYKMPLGEREDNFVWLYTDDDVRALRDYASKQHPGRPKKEDL